jgi:outer membrane protein TolC
MATAPRQGFSSRPVPILSLSLLLLSMAFSPATAAETVESVGFSEAVAHALQRNAAVSVAGFDLEVAKRDVEIARGLYLPNLTFEEKFVRSSAPAEVFGLKMNRQMLTADDFADPVASFNNPAPFSDFITSLSVEQPIYAPRAIVGYRMAKQEAGAREMDTARAKEETAYRVVSAYLGVLTAKEFVGVTEKALEAARRHYELAGKVERAGLGLASDGLRARVAMAEAEAASVTAKNRLELARKALSLSMGESGGTSVDAVGDPPPMPPAGTLEERIAQARKARTDLDAIAIRAKNAESNVELEKTGYLPTVGLRAGYQLDGENPLNPDNRTWNVGVGFRWNLFDGMRNEASVARARGESGKAKEQLRGAGDRASFQVSQAYMSVIDAEARVAIAREAVAAAEEGVRLIRARYENQLGKMIDVLDAQSALDGARAGQVRAANDLRQSQADLEFATGTLLPWAMQGLAQNRQEGTK